jgi:glycine/D-amino acid oxidase-like deaminating enzyme
MSLLNLYSHTPDDVMARLSDQPEGFPRTADVVVLGGGIVGAATAFHLAGAGLRVVLVEKDKVAAQQSGRNWGFVRTQYRDPAEMPLAVEALSQWPMLDAQLGQPTGFRQTGCIFVAKDKAEFTDFERWIASVDHVARDARMMSPAEVAAQMPAFAGRNAGALYTATDGQAEPVLATVAFARAAAARGARVLEDCGAVEIEVAGGRVAGVLTEHGVIRSSAVVCAAGAASHRFLGHLGLMLPQQTVRNTVSLTRPLPTLSPACFCGLGIGLRQRADGSCILAAESISDIDLTLDSVRAAGYFLPSLLRHRKTFDFAFGRPFVDDVHNRLARGRRERAIEPRRPRIPPNVRRAHGTAALFRNLFRDAVDATIAKSWAGQIDVLPDALPVIDAPAEIPGLVIATGFSGHGFGLGPAVGRIVAALVEGRDPRIALDAFRLDRFARGTYARPHAPL